jgi:hypothetical protein
VAQHALASTGSVRQQRSCGSVPRLAQVSTWLRARRCLTPVIHRLGQALARLPKLVEIDVGNCQLGDSGLVLFLGEDAQSAGPEHVASVGDVAGQLSTIDLSNNALTDHSALLVAKFVKRQSALEELALHTNHWTDHVVPIFADALADKPQVR